MSRVDVIIPTYNRHERLQRTLEALSRQTVRDIRVIVADDGSSPPVADTIDCSALRGLQVEVLRLDGNGGPARARNAAIAHATSEYVAFTDDDVDPEPNWVERHLAHHAGRRVISFGPLAIPLDWRPTPWNWWEARTLAREYERMTAGLYPASWRQVFTGNAMARRQDLVAAGSFDESFTRAEDIELALRLHRSGVEVVFAADAIGFHHARRSFASWSRIAREYARFDALLDGLYPDLDWEGVVVRERSARPASLRAARALLALPGVLPCVRLPAGLVSRALFKMGQRRLAMVPLSLLYDAEYERSWRAAHRSVPGRLPPVNPRSTAGEQYGVTSETG